MCEHIWKDETKKIEISREWDPGSVYERSCYRASYNNIIGQRCTLCKQFLILREITTTDRE